MAKILMKGNEAIAEAALRAGCRLYFGYPITPQNEIPEYMARRMPQVGGTFLQAESEVAAINMVYGAAGTGKRVMTSSSSPGISLKQEGLSYIAGAELPCVVVNMVRGGPGLGGIQPAQSDYFQATRGGGHGDYRMVVMAPSTVQEAAQMVVEAFDIADEYRIGVMILGDGMIGQIMEPVDFDAIDFTPYEYQVKPWATVGSGKKGGQRSVVNSLYIEPDALEKVNARLQDKYDAITEKFTRCEHYQMADAEIALVAYGTMARICKNAVNMARESGIKAGLIRPQLVWPFPTAAIADAAKQAKHIISVEMSLGQMVDDVRIAANGACPVSFFGRTGGVIPTPEEVLQAIQQAGGTAK
ncbi:3-methyl-2-oxobutanoate dehydrogenase subunit VorB [Eubacteriales bacterium OttesenSCG-928-N14]|nr:3-methyl-2-oxobutanoate dehydrogenase subunit VorB [Eubacteriales bacterium OttesenSCG-928-N14]